jgi:uncharacterized membrane protein YfcA
VSEALAALLSAPWPVLVPFIVIGLVSQVIDGALGAAFGMVSHTLLVMLGIPPAAASAATHSIEAFTSGASGLAHALQRNVDWVLFARVVIPGIVGGLFGVWLLSFASLGLLHPVLLVYMAAVGTYLIWHAPRQAQTFRRIRFVRSIGFVGGVLDASGGGWGPVVTGNLVAQGLTPRTAIGTANAAEFFVTVTILSALVGSFGAEVFSLAAIGLLIGGLLGAPFSAWLTRRLSSKLLMLLIGTVLVALSLYGIVSLVFEPVPSFPRF